jgi:hypothetical protein
MQNEEPRPVTLVHEELHPVASEAALIGLPDPQQQLWAFEPGLREEVATFSSLSPSPAVLLAEANPVKETLQRSAHDRPDEQSQRQQQANLLRMQRDASLQREKQRQQEKQALLEEEVRALKADMATMQLAREQEREQERQQQAEIEAESLGRMLEAELDAELAEEKRGEQEFRRQQQILLEEEAHALQAEMAALALVRVNA